jgi:hypothetical protein
MRAVGLAFGARFRRRWASWLALAVLIALVSGVVLAAVAAGRRTDSAFPRFVSRYGFDAIVYGGPPAAQLAQLPEVAQVVPGPIPFYGHLHCTCRHQINEGDFALRQVPGTSLGRVVKLTAGRMPDPSNRGEALASSTLADDYHVRPGTVIRFPLYAPSQQAAVFAQTSGPLPRPRGPTVALRIVGIAVAENEFPSGQTPTYTLYPSQAFITAYRSTPALPVHYVRLRGGQADFARFENSHSALQGAGVQDLDRPAAAITASIHPQAIGWWVLAVLAGLAGIAVLGQALARQASADSADYPVLAALGMESRHLVTLSMLWTAIAAGAGGAGGVALAALLSPFAPTGEARLAEPSPGLAFDTPVLVLGAAVTVAAVLALGLLPALRSARVYGSAPQAPPVRSSLVVKAVTAAGAPATAIIGVRHALERARSARPVPVRTALAGTVAAVIALCATAVFGASLSHLTDSPELYGAPFQAVFNTGSGATSKSSLLTELGRDTKIDRITVASVPAITVGHISVRAITVQPVRGPVLLSAVRGQLPAGDGQIALGASTMRKVGAHIGSVVRVAVTPPGGGAPRAGRYAVVGLVSFPGDLGTGGLGSGAVLTTAGYLDTQCPAGPAQQSCRSAAQDALQSVVLVHATPGAAGDAALARHIRLHRENAYRPKAPAALVSFGESANFPLFLGAVLVLWGAATLLHLLVVSVSRRRSESGLLKALGFLRRQVSMIVFWQATAVAIVGIAAGVPLGVAAGQAVWRAFAVYLGAVAVPVAPGWLITALAGGVLLAANLIAAMPALAAARPRAGQVLRTE